MLKHYDKIFFNISIESGAILHVSPNSSCLRPIVAKPFMKLSILRLAACVEHGSLCECHYRSRCGYRQEVTIKYWNEERIPPTPGRSFEQSRGSMDCTCNAGITRPEYRSTTVRWVRYVDGPSRRNKCHPFSKLTQAKEAWRVFESIYKDDWTRCAKFSTLEVASSGNSRSWYGCSPTQRLERGTMPIRNQKAATQHFWSLWSIRKGFAWV